MCRSLARWTDNTPSSRIFFTANFSFVLDLRNSCLSHRAVCLATAVCFWVPRFFPLSYGGHLVSPHICFVYQWTQEHRTMAEQDWLHTYCFNSRRSYSRWLGSIYLRGFYSTSWRGYDWEVGFGLMNSLYGKHSWKHIGTKCFQKKNKTF